MKRVFVLFLGLLLFSTSAWTGTYRYIYTGPFFTTVAGAYTTSNRLVAEFTTATPLSANLVNSDISGLVTSWNFNDGVQVLNNGNSLFGHPSVPRSYVSTDANGNIIGSRIWIFKAPLTTTLGQTQALILKHTTLDQAVLAGSCTNVSGGVCDNWNVGPDNASANSLGFFWELLPPVTETVPALPIWGLGLLGLALALAARRRLKAG